MVFQQVVQVAVVERKVVQRLVVVVLVVLVQAMVAVLHLQPIVVAVVEVQDICRLFLVETAVRVL
jgi:hypothetical protein